MNEAGPNDLLVAQLRAWAPKHGHMCIEHGDASELRVQRDGLLLKLVVPHGVSEWFVDVCDASGKVLLHDWLDYAGYDNTPADALAREMEDEVMRFADTIVLHPLRLAQAGTPTALQLQWRDGLQWRACLPFSAVTSA